MRTLGELALLVGLEHALHCESFKDLPSGVQLRLWEEVTPMVPITAALLRKFDLHHLLEDNRTLGGARGVHRDALELLGQYEKEQRRSATEADAHVGLRSLCVRAVHPKPKGMHGLLAPFRQLRSLSLHVFIKPDDLRCLRGMTQLRRLDLSKSSLCDKGMTYLAIASLEELSIAECKMATDVGMLALTQKKDVLTKLRVLDIARTKFTPKALITVSELTSLEAVNAACIDLDDRAFLRWTRTLRLTHLNIHATLVTGESFRHIIRMSHLRYLDMSGIFSSTQSPRAVLAAPRLEYADVSHSLPGSYWHRDSDWKTSKHLRVLVGPKPANRRLLPQRAHVLDAHELPRDIRGACLALQTGVCDGDEDLADAAIKLLNLNLTPGMETYDHSNFEGFVASLAAEKFGRARRRSPQSQAKEVPRKPKFANKKERYDHFKLKAEAGRHLLDEYFLRRVHDHGAGPPAFTPLPPRVAVGLRFFAAAHLNYFRERQSKLVRDRGPDELLRYCIGTHPRGISLTDIDVLATNVMVYLNELFTRLRTGEGHVALQASEYCAKSPDSSASGHRSNDLKNDRNSHKTAASPLNLASLTQRREVGMVERAVRLLARLVAVGEASPNTRVIEIVVEIGGLRLAVDILWYLGMAGVDAALSLVCMQIITDLVTHATPPPIRVWGDAVSHYSSLYRAKAKAELAASRLWQSRLCKAGLLFADADPDIGELVLHAFPLTLGSLSVSGLGQLVIGNVANYVRERRPPFAQDWFKPFQRAGPYTTRIMAALRESRTLSETASTAPDLTLHPPTAFFAHGTENALRLLLAAVLRSARAADTVGREAWARERREEKDHASSVAEAWAKVVDSPQRFKAGFWRAACEKRATAHVRDGYAADSCVDSAVQDRCDQFVASFVEAGGVALLVDIVERASAPGCGERERRIALALVEVGERYEDRSATLHLKREREQWHAQWSQWERQRRIAHVAAALLRALVATDDHQPRNEARSKGKEKVEAAESSPHHHYGADDDDMELEREPDVPLTSLEPGPGMDYLLARALSLHDTTPATPAAAWGDEVGLQPYIDIVRAKRATEAQNRLRRLKKKQRKQPHPAPTRVSSTTA